MIGAFFQHSLYCWIFVGSSDPMLRLPYASLFTAHRCLVRPKYPQCWCCRGSSRTAAAPARSVCCGARSMPCAVSKPGAVVCTATVFFFFLQQPFSFGNSKKKIVFSSFFANGKPFEFFCWDPRFSAGSRLAEPSVRFGAA